MAYLIRQSGKEEIGVTPNKGKGIGMTEAEWLVCCDPLKMLQHLKADLKSRKVLLLQAECVRRVWGSVSADCRAWTELLEAVAEGRETWDRTEDEWGTVESEIYG